MKKYISIFVFAALIIGCLSACNYEKNETAEDSNKLKIVTTIFPQYDWVMNILGNNPSNAEVTMLLDKGVDLHSFQPSADDILKISNCDIFIYVGGESDAWVEKTLQQAKNEDMLVINLMEVLGNSVKEEEMVEGMQEEDHDHAHADGEEQHGEEHEHEHEHEGEEAEYDEHIWLSLRNASLLAEKISKAIQALDSKNVDIYKKNSEAYIERLNALDAEYKAVVSGAGVSTLLFGDRFPFRYLTDDYGLSYYAAFVGCSAETEADFETISFLAKKMDELSLHSIMTIEGSDHRIAETIIKNTKSKDQKILTLDSMQSITAKDVQSGASYLSIMEKNLSVLKDALK